MNQEELIFLKAMEYDKGDAKRIQHFTKVYSYAKLIAAGEDMEEESKKILGIAAILHDIGIHECEKKYHSTAGKYQEELGPDIARELLEGFELSEQEVERICYLIAHHHTYDAMDGLDYQILVEADFLVNLYEDSSKQSAIETAYQRIFKTATGKAVFQSMYGV